jgi:hypothetical protein
MRYRVRTLLIGATFWLPARWSWRLRELVEDRTLLGR